MTLEAIKPDGIIERIDMKIDRDNLIDTIVYYMEDNDLDYLHIRGSVSVSGELNLIISEDLEHED